MDGSLPKRGDRTLGGAPEGLDALTVAERLKAEGGVGLFVARAGLMRNVKLGKA